MTNQDRREAHRDTIASNPVLEQVTLSDEDCDLLRDALGIELDTLGRSTIEQIIGHHLGTRKEEVEPEHTPPLTFLRRLQSEARYGFHRNLQSWVDDGSSVARVLQALSETDESRTDDEIAEAAQRVAFEVLSAHYLHSDSTGYYCGPAERDAADEQGEHTCHWRHDETMSRFEVDMAHQAHLATELSVPLVPSKKAR